jgi:nucleotide-binding universal stress UspA family protein
MTTLAKDKAVVVVGDDYSQNSIDALEAACSLTESLTDVAFHIVHVIKLRHVFGGDANSSSNATSIDAPSDDFANERAALEAVTSRVAAEAAAANRAHVFGHLRIGNPAREIVQLASDLSADLIVVGTHGRTGMTKLLLGSVARNVLSHASCPVLVVKPKTLPSWAQIEPPCLDCVAARESSYGQRVWCDRHFQHHANAHTYYVHTESFGLGTQTLRGLS